MTLWAPASALETIACAAWLFGTTPRDVLSRSRHQAHCVPRYAVCKALRVRGTGYARIGQHIGRHHSTAINAVQRADEIMAGSYFFADAVATLVALRDGEFLEMQRREGCKRRIPMLRKPKQPKDIVVWE